MDETLESSGVMLSDRSQQEEGFQQEVDEQTLSYHRIDHIALAVNDLESAVTLFQDVLGFKLTGRRHVKGAHTGMISAELEINGIRFVLCQGTEPASQVSRLVSQFGPGIAHVAFEVDDVEATVNHLAGNGLGFDTNVIRGPGLTQAFSSRCANTGMSFEFIKRGETDGFLDGNVQELFEQLERSGKY